MASAQAIRPCVARASAVNVSEKFAAIQPPTNALITPETAHQANTAQLTALGALSALGTSTDRSPKPSPIITSST